MRAAAVKIAQVVQGSCNKSSNTLLYTTICVSTAPQLSMLCLWPLAGEDREESFVIFTMQSTSSASPTASLDLISQHYTMVIGSYALLRVCHNNSERRQGPLSVCCCSMGCRKPVSFRFQNILTHARATHTEIWKAFRSCVCGGRVWGY